VGSYAHGHTMESHFGYIFIIPCNCKRVTVYLLLLLKFIIVFIIIGNARGRPTDSFYVKYVNHNLKFLHFRSTMSVTDLQTIILVEG
jgi:hypothetical protein